MQSDIPSKQPQHQLVCVSDRPQVLVGASFGRALGTAVQTFGYPDIDLRFYAIMGGAGSAPCAFRCCPTHTNTHTVFRHCFAHFSMNTRFACASSGPGRLSDRTPWTCRGVHRPDAHPHVQRCALRRNFVQHAGPPLHNACLARTCCLPTSLQSPHALSLSFLLCWVGDGPTASCLGER